MHAFRYETGNIIHYFNSKMISFGPVLSRRLGKSLGINNIVTPKTCSYNCIYCQVGNTTRQSSSREAFFKPQTILNKIEQHIEKLNNENRPDFLTFVSNGEPTLDSSLGEAITLLKKTGIPVAVITNASLLEVETVRADLSLADWISLKIDAGDSNTWMKINRPVSNLDFDTILNNIYVFAREYKGILCTETMLVKETNDSADNFRKLAEIIKKISPRKAYLAVPTRPPSVSSVKAPDTKTLNLAWQIFNNMRIRTELLTGFEGIDNGYTGNIYDDILNITAVHPLREDSLIKLLENDHADFSVVRSLLRQRLIRSTKYNGNKYYLREYHMNL